MQAVPSLRSELYAFTLLTTALCHCSSKPLSITEVCQRMPKACSAWLCSSQWAAALHGYDLWLHLLKCV